MRSSIAWTFSSSRAVIARWAKGSYLKSASAGPRQRLSASASVADRTSAAESRAESSSRLNRLASTDSGVTVRRYPFQTVCRSSEDSPLALSGSSERRRRDTRPWTTVAAVRGG